MPVPEGQRRTVQVKLRLPPNVAEALRALAEQRGLSVSEVVALMVAPKLAPPKTKLPRPDAKRERDRIFAEWLPTATPDELHRRLTAANEPVWMQTAMDRRLRVLRATLDRGADWTDEDPGLCTQCGKTFELVRPGKSQPTCSCWDEPT